MAAEAKRTMRIIGLEAENFKRIRAVNLALNGDHLILGGENESGKSSILDAIWVALGGPDVMKDLHISKPIREGETSACITLNLGDLIVTRNWTSDEKSYLKVRTADGANYTSPQGMLNTLMGPLFDPLEFSRIKGAEQKGILLSLVDIGIDLDKWQDERNMVYAERTDVNRELTRLNNTLKSIPEIEAPDAEIASSDVLADMNQAQQVKEANDRQRMAVNEAERSARIAEMNVIQDSKKIESIQEHIASLQRDLKELTSGQAEEQSKAKTLKEEYSKLSESVAALVDPDMSIFQTRLSEVESINAKVRAKKQRQSLVADRDRVETETKALTSKLEALDSQKSNAIKSAIFPIDGLGFDDSGVTFNGIPFGQCSSEERIRIAMSIAMAMNPTLKVIRISDGSLLDDKNFLAIQNMASERGYQLLIERVGNPGELGVIIEDGAVQESEAANA